VADDRSSAGICWIASAGRPEAARAGRGRRTAQQHRAAGLEADRRRVGRHVGPALVDHADDAHRHTDLLHPQSVGQGRSADHLTHRVGQGGDVPQAVGDRRDPVGVEPEAIDDVLPRAGLTRDLDVDRVLGDDRVGGGDERVGHRVQGGILVDARRDGERRRCDPRGSGRGVNLFQHGRHPIAAPPATRPALARAGGGQTSIRSSRWTTSRS
jgi:hypothetical protein